MSLRERLEAARIGPEPMTRIVYADDLDGVLAALRGAAKTREALEEIATFLGQSYPMPRAIHVRCRNIARRALGRES